MWLKKTKDNLPPKQNVDEKTKANLSPKQDEDEKPIANLPQKQSNFNFSSFFLRDECLSSFN